MPEDTQMTESQRDISNIMKIYIATILCETLLML